MPVTDNRTTQIRRQVRGLLRRGRSMTMGYVRPMTGTAGTLPSILIVGGQRCGTTVLHTHLSQHPQVRTAYIKEVHYFTFHHDRGQRWYAGQFPAVEDGVRTIDASPLYLFEPVVPQRAAALLPDAHIIALLRDPVRRAYSHYQHNRDDGVEPLSFAEALDAEPARLAQAETLPWREGLRLRQRASYVARGHYAPQLSRWFEAYPREQIHILRSEDFYRSTEQSYAELLTFLGLTPHSPAEGVRQNRAGEGAADELTPELVERLRREFSASNRELENLLGWSSSWDY